MVLRKILLSILPFTFLQASEFPFIQPIAVEKAPIIKKTDKTTLVKIEKKAVVKKTKKVQNDLTDTMLLDINFQTNSDKITSDSDDKILEFANYLKRNKGYQIVIYGYTDDSGNKAKNLILSQKRANRVINRLENMGISITRLTAVGMGSKDSIADNSTPEGREKNRRIEALIIK